MGIEWLMLSFVARKHHDRGERTQQNQAIRPGPPGAHQTN
ncbi:hypothetical protein AFE_0514 [Acidithiobacillus ferrooxidans ATCC 23270]|uniref:Uncharacterized protein n=1 Tax=Acidithiobacillus ferrooxidans (strain ATCC 23270 / DSM 14882 / CIP 104768 / NCIMB 8455) TaxID=243159 RepID=B7J534_ACIF2|nr:hypothetical protein AFE_0514 [Acidithiobacillus ferrooxidans ATCC 23270]